MSFGARRQEQRDAGSLAIGEIDLELIADPQGFGSAIELAGFCHQAEVGHQFAASAEIAAASYALKTKTRFAQVLFCRSEQLGGAVDMPLPMGLPSDLQPLQDFALQGGAEAFDSLESTLARGLLQLVDTGDAQLPVDFEHLFGL